MLSCQKLSFRPRGGNAQAPHRCDTTFLEIVSWTANTPTSPRPNLRAAIAALGRCNSFAKHHDLVGCQICIPSTASHVMSGTLRRAAPSSSRNCMPEQRQPEADHPGYQANGEKARGHNWSYSMSPTRVYINVCSAARGPSIFDSLRSPSAQPCRSKFGPPPPSLFGFTTQRARTCSASLSAAAT